MDVVDVYARLGSYRATGEVCGERAAGVRAPAVEDRFGAFVDYCRARLVEDPHLWVEVLLDELRPLGFDQSYATLTRQLRMRGLRPHCEACSAAKGRAVAIIEHPPGEETLCGTLHKTSYVESAIMWTLGPAGRCWPCSAAVSACRDAA